MNPMPDAGTTLQRHEGARLLEDYQPVPGTYDEMCSEPGALRSHWEYLARCLATLGPGALVERRQEMLRLLRENGVTYNVYGTPEGMERPWALDPIPYLITSREWAVIERGLMQRAELPNAILADLYGPRDLLRKGFLPVELVHAHPGFLRACVGVPVRGRHLLLYAADLTRSPDGAVWVMGDRAQAPSGAGYALENRIVVSRVLPSVFRDSHVHRLAHFFRTVRSALALASPRPLDPPRIVLLTPGPGNEAYFEHAYLANYLGYSLVQGSDLTVRNGVVWLKTLDGLQRVDVVLRRLDDTFCDPLELRGDSLLGAPGLLAAARLGNVTLANALGSGVLENPGLMAFLPALCRKILGEDLRIPSVATWWCGGDKEREYVLANLHRLVVKPVFPHPARCTLFGSRLSAAERQALAERIRARPYLYVGQEQVRLSNAPVLADARMEPRAMALRTFLVAGEEGYAAMPGGLTRVAASGDSQLVSSQAGGASKDTWVLASEPERHVTLLPPAGRPLPLTRTGGEVPSRVADDLFWLGRYAERADYLARLLRETMLLLLEPETSAPELQLPVLLRAVTKMTATEPGFVGEGAERRLAAPEPELLSLVNDGARAGTLAFTLDAAVTAGRSVRSRLSDDAWRVINRLGMRAEPPATLGQGVAMTEGALTALAAFASLSSESMSRGQGLRFYTLGRRLERALDSVALLRFVATRAAEAGQPVWDVLLAVTDSVTTYRRRYRGAAQAGAVLDLVLCDESSARSVAYQLAALEREVGRLPRRGSIPHRTQEERLAIEALAAVRLADVERLADLPADAAGPGGLEPLLVRVAQLGCALSDAITAAYFSHAELPQQLVSLR